MRTAWQTIWLCIWLLSQVLGFTLPAPQCGNGLCEQLSYCEPIRATGPVAFVNPFRFSTKYCDDKTGHYYYGHRYYNPTTGWWLSRDPLNESGGLHLYAFCGNDPVDFIDVLGLNGRAGSPGFHPISLSYWTLFFRGAPDWARPDGSYGWDEYPGSYQNNIGSQSNSNQMRDDEFAAFEEPFIKRGLEAGCKTLHVSSAEIAEAKKHIQEVLKAPIEGPIEAGTLLVGTGAVKAGGSVVQKGGFWKRIIGCFKKEKSAEKTTEIVAQNGTKITGFTKHGIDRVVGDGTKRAGVKPEALLDALKNPKKITSGVDSQGRPYQVFIGQEARVVINPQTGEVISANPLSGAGAH